MKVIINKESKSLVCDFNGNTYTIPEFGFISIPDDLYEHLKELWPLSLNFEPELTEKDKAKIKEVEFKPTINKFTGGQFGIQTKKIGKDLTTNIPNGTDKDGVEWYGPGLESDTP